jgi:colicin import membrane protein
MRAPHDNSGALLLSLAAHAVMLVALWFATITCAGWNAFVVAAKLPEFLITECRKPIDVEGPVIEAVLMIDVGAPQVQPEPRPAPPPPRPQPRPPEPPREELRVAPPPAEDPVEQERVARDGELPALEQQRREQEERRRREQRELEERERLDAVERERQRQLEDIRRQREQAERERQREEQRLAEIDRRREIERQRMEQLADQERREREGQRAGTGATNTDLLARYAMALQQVVTQNWLRPDTAQPGLQCTVRIIQVPGGEVVAARVIQPCNGDDLTRRSLEAAVLRAQPLPYAGFESVFEREISFVFRFDG